MITDKKIKILVHKLKYEMKHVSVLKSDIMKLEKASSEELVVVNAPC